MPVHGGPNSRIARDSQNSRGRFTGVPRQIATGTLDKTFSARMVARYDAAPPRAGGGFLVGIRNMAKQNTVLIKLVSTADTGFFYVKKKNPKKTTNKLEFRKYDPVVRKHVAFKESKIK